MIRMLTCIVWWKMCKKGERHLYIYNPAPVDQPRVETRENRITAIREAQNNNLQIATIRAGFP